MAPHKSSAQKLSFLEFRNSIRYKAIQPEHHRKVLLNRGCEITLVYAYKYICFFYSEISSTGSYSPIRQKRMVIILNAPTNKFHKLKRLKPIQTHRRSKSLSCPSARWQCGERTTCLGETRPLFPRWRTAGSADFSTENSASHAT